MSQTSWLARQRLMWVGADDLLSEPVQAGSGPSTAPETRADIRSDAVRGSDNPSLRVFLFFKTWYLRRHAAA
jgi:hypothetical protein